MIGLAAIALLAASGRDQALAPYRWKSVQMVGAGFVDGIVFHPTAKGVRYARTDMGGAYRWDTKSNRWMPMLDWLPYTDLNLMGVESIAIDPRDPKAVYLACGTYTNPSTPDGAILSSHDGGKSFVLARVPIKFGGNENGRGNGERMSVDPFDGKHLLLGTRRAGLWESRDGGVHWQRCTSFPAEGGPRGAGIVVTLFDPAAKGVVYAAVSDAASPTLYRTADAGATWAAVPGAPTGLYPTHLVRAEDGTLWLTYGSNPGPAAMTSGAVYKYREGTWTDVTPERPDIDHRFGYAAVSAVKGAVIVSSFYRPGGEQIFRSLDAGKTWRPTIGGKDLYDYRKAPYQARTGIHWLFDIEIDPFDPDHGIFTTGYGGHETFNLTAADRGGNVRWEALATGIEESVALSLASPTAGAHLVSAIGDYGGFVHRDLDRPAPEGNFTNPHFGNTTSLGVGDLAPGTIVRVGVESGGGKRNAAYSLDGGKSWTPTTSIPPGGREGKISVSADGSTWVWTIRDGTYRTSDHGATWNAVSGLPAGLPVVADRVSSQRFYAMDLFAGKLFVSDDRAATFRERLFDLPRGLPKRGGDRGDSRGGQDALYATPGRVGELWIVAYDGLYRMERDRPFVRIPGVEQLHAFGFGRAAKGRHDPALYLVGTVKGQRGIFRSDDSGATWLRINDDAHQWGLVLLISGDPKRYGRVYVGTHGRGILYGDPR